MLSRLQTVNKSEKALKKKIVFGFGLKFVSLGQYFLSQKVTLFCKVSPLVCQRAFRAFIRLK